MNLSGAGIARVIWLRRIIVTLFACLLAALSGGLLIWLATAQPADFYLLRSIQGQSVANVWLFPAHESSLKPSGNLSHLSFSLWLSPAKFPTALRHFDHWLEEYSLLREETDEAAGDDSQTIPPSILPNDEAELSSTVDPYDLAFANLFEDIWSSGAVSIAGSAHFDIPFWGKPFFGWIQAQLQTAAGERFLEKIFDHIGSRRDGTDLASWIGELPFANLPQPNSYALIHSVLIHLDGIQIAKLYGQLCEARNISELWCEPSDLITNPFEPLLYASENFQTQVRIYWTVRGQHFLWSNSEKCLEKMLASSASAELNCGEVSNLAALNFSQKERSLLRPTSRKSNRNGAGFYLNQMALQRCFDEVVQVLSGENVAGASWLQDTLVSANGERVLKSIQMQLRGSALMWPSWGAILELNSSHVGHLSTFVRRLKTPEKDELVDRKAANSQFEFLSGLTSAWWGLPRGEGRLESIRPWQRQHSFWTAVSEYRLGWSE
ncbi:hypothetical protein EBU99_01470 [bacterium]|nr:hypothetical protein [bacterium]